MVIQEMPNSIETIVRGHTDDAPVGEGSIYKDNWELSAARAVSVTRELINAGVNPKRLSAAGHSSYRPITINSTPQGRARNRRVELHFVGQQQTGQKGIQKSILDTQAQ